MEYTRVKLLSAALGLIVTSSATLADTPVSDAYSPGESDSQWIVGGTVLAWENPYINEGDIDGGDDDGEYNGAIVPRVEYRGERFFIDGDGLGVNLFRKNGFSTGLKLTGNATYLSDHDNYDDNDRLATIKERDATADLGLYVIHNYNNGQLKVTAWQEISNEHDGHSVEARYSYNFPLGRWNITPMAGVTWASDELVNHFYGVSEAEASGDITAYKGKSTTSYFGGVAVRFDINDHWDVRFNTAFVSLGDGIKDSSIVSDSTTVISGVGVNYNF